MRTFLTVFFKELLDNVRDRRTLASALIMGPIFGPVLFAVVINMSIDRALDDAESVMVLPVIGQEHAPNLMRFLESRNIDIVAGPEDAGGAAEAVKSGLHDVVLVVPENFGEQLADTIPARVELYSDEANSHRFLWLIGLWLIGLCIIDLGLGNRFIGLGNRFIGLGFR